MDRAAVSPETRRRRGLVAPRRFESPRRRDRAGKPDASRDDDARLWHDAQTASSKLAAREEQKQLRQQVDRLHAILKNPEYQVRFHAQSEYEEPQRRLYGPAVQKAKGAADRASRDAQRAWMAREAARSARIENELETAARSAAAAERTAKADALRARASTAAATNANARRDDATLERGSDAAESAVGL